MKNLALGSNQYRTRRKDYARFGFREFTLTRANWKDLTVLAVTIYIVTLMAISFQVSKSAALNIRATDLVKKASAAMPRFPITESPDSQQQQVIDEVNRVFGDDATKAFHLLSCENHALNPKAMNDNTAWGGVGHDWGIFQINDSWQGVTNRAFLTDYKINIAMAYSIYSRDGHSFKLWTCGRKLGL